MAAAVEAGLFNLACLFQWTGNNHTISSSAATSSKAQPFLLAATANGRARNATPKDTCSDRGARIAPQKRNGIPPPMLLPASAVFLPPTERTLVFPQTAEGSEEGLLPQETASLRWRCSTCTSERVPRQESGETQLTTGQVHGPARFSQRVHPISASPRDVQAFYTFPQHEHG